MGYFGVQGETNYVKPEPEPEPEPKCEIWVTQCWKCTEPRNLEKTSESTYARFYKCPVCDAMAVRRNT